MPFGRQKVARSCAARVKYLTTRLSRSKPSPFLTRQRDPQVRG